MYSKRAFLLKTLICFSALASSAPLSSAVTYTVTDLTDSVTPATPGSLRYGIYQMNAGNISSGTIQFSPGLSGTIHLAQSLMPIVNVPAIDLNGNTVTITGGNTFAGLFVAPNVTTTISGGNLIFSQTASIGGNGGSGISGNRRRSAGRWGRGFLFDLTHPLQFLHLQRWKVVLHMGGAGV